MNFISKLMLLFLAIFVWSCKNEQAPKPNEPITIATAANMQPAMEEIIKLFTQKKGVKCELITSASGKLTAQILEGAPYDVFVSADMKYPGEVFKKGLATEAPKIYANGKLVLWSMYDSISPSIEILTSEDIKHIAIANPKTAPYGVAATEVLSHYGIFDKVANKLVYGESISQTNQFITSRSAELGFTSMSAVLSPEMKGKGKWLEMKAGTFNPIQQGAVVIKHNGEAKLAALAFFEYMFTEEAKTILRNFGYSVNE